MEQLRTHLRVIVVKATVDTACSQYEVHARACAAGFAANHSAVSVNVSELYPCLNSEARVCQSKLHRRPNVDPWRNLAH